jgi:hypothetical protein
MTPVAVVVLAARTRLTGAVPFGGEAVVDLVRPEAGEVLVVDFGAAPVRASDSPRLVGAVGIEPTTKRL